MIQNAKKSDNEIPRIGAALPPAGAPSALGTRSGSPALRSSGAPSVIGADLLITGNLVSKGEVQVDGEVQGDIHSVHVVIGEKARITGGIVADEIVVRGHVMGTVRGKRVILQTSSQVEGDIYHQTLAIEQGAFFEGKSRRTDDPTGGFNKAASSQPPAIPGSGS
jgi:cytoskeletal protein CcmA (bactofilin family)